MGRMPAPQHSFVAEDAQDALGLPTGQLRLLRRPFGTFAPRPNISRYAQAASVSRARAGSDYSASREERQAHLLSRRCGNWRACPPRCLAPLRMSKAATAELPPGAAV